MTRVFIARFSTVHRPNFASVTAEGKTGNLPFRAAGECDGGRMVSRWLRSSRRWLMECGIEKRLGEVSMGSSKDAGSKSMTPVTTGVTGGGDQKVFVDEVVVT